MDIAAERVAGCKSIDPNLDLGNTMTVAGYEAKFGETQTALEEYNSILALADEKLNVFLAKERELRDWNERMLSGVKTKYGADSNEYEKAGGTKKSERARPVRKPKEVVTA